MCIRDSLEPGLWLWAVLRVLSPAPPAPAQRLVRAVDFRRQRVLAARFAIRLVGVAGRTGAAGPRLAGGLWRLAVCGASCHQCGLRFGRTAGSAGVRATGGIG